MRPLQNPEISTPLAEIQIYPYQGTNVYLKRDPVFENSKIVTKKENKPPIRQKILV